VDDGVRAGLITVDDLLDVRVFSRFHAMVIARYPELPPRRVLYETIRRMVDYLVSDVITESQKNIVESSVDSIQAVRAHSRQLISLSENVLAEHQELKRFLRTKLYNHPSVREVMDEAGATLKGLFEAYMKEPSRLPPEHQSLFERAESGGGRAAAARVVADYVAGMTDRFAYQEWDKLKLSRGP